MNVGAYYRYRWLELASLGILDFKAPDGILKQESNATIIYTMCHQFILT